MNDVNNGPKGAKKGAVIIKAVTQPKQKLLLTFTMTTLIQIKYKLHQIEYFSLSLSCGMDYYLDEE